MRLHVDVLIKARPRCHMFYYYICTFQGAQIVRKYGAGDTAAYSWFQYIYANLDKLSNDATANMTTNDVIM